MAKDCKSRVDVRTMMMEEFVKAAKEEEEQKKQDFGNESQ